MNQFIELIIFEEKKKKKKLKAVINRVHQFSL